MSVRKRVLAFACAPPGRPGVGTQARLLSTSRSSRNGASGASVGVSSKPAPSATGVHCSMTMPFGTYITPNRVIGFAGSVLQRRERRHHRVEQRQRHRRAEPSQHRAPRNGFLRDQHLHSLLWCCGGRDRRPIAASRVVLIVNGVLRTMPMMSDDQRYPPEAAFFVICRIAGQVGRFDAAPERISQQLLRERAREVFLMPGHQLAQAGRRPRTSCRPEARPTHRSAAHRLTCATCRAHRSSRARSRADPSARGTPRTTGSCGALPSARGSSAAAVGAPSWSDGTSGGGGGGGAPRMLSSSHRPRSTGDVRLGYDVTVRMLPCPSSPPRLPSANVTRRKWLP